MSHWYQHLQLCTRALNKKCQAVCLYIYLLTVSTRQAFAGTGCALNLQFNTVLVLAGIELIFFIVASVGLRFGFVLETALVIQACFHYCRAVLRESGPFLLLTPPHQQVGWGCTRSWEGTQLGQLTPTAQRDIPDHMMPCSAYKAGRRRRKRGMFRVMAFCLPK